MANAFNGRSAAVKDEASDCLKRFLRLKPIIAAGAIGLSIISTCKSADTESSAVQVSTAQVTSQSIASIGVSTPNVQAIEVSTPNVKSDIRDAKASAQPISLSTVSLLDVNESAAVEHAVTKSTTTKAEKPQRCDARTIDENTPMEKLVACLDDKDLSGRGMAIDALAGMPKERIPRAARKRIEELTKDSDFNVRESAVGALGKIGMISSLPAVQAAINDENGWVRSAARDSIAYFIGRGADAAIIQTLEHLLKSDNQNERIEAIVILCLIDSPYANKLFQERLRKGKRTSESTTIPFKVNTLRFRLDTDGRAKPIGLDELVRRFDEVLKNEKDPEMRDMLEFFVKSYNMDTAR